MTGQSSYSTRTRDEKIADQKDVRVIRTDKNIYQLIDGASYPVEIANDVLFDIHRLGQSDNYAKNVANNIACWIKEAGHAGVSWLEPPSGLYSDYFRIRIDGGLTSAAANVEASRNHKVIKRAVDVGRIPNYFYPTKVVEAGVKGKFRRFIAPDFLQASATPPQPILPSPSQFCEHCAALPEDAKLVAEVLQKTGIRIGELDSFAAEWATRQYAASGAAVVLILGKGKRWRNVYVPPDLARRLDAALLNRSYFLRANGRRWTKDSLSAAFTAASHATGLRITAHKLRHAFGSWAFYRARRLFAEGKLHAEPILIVQVLLGHASWETTQGIYCNVFSAEADGSYVDLGGCPIEVLIDAMEPATIAGRKVAQ